MPAIHRRGENANQSKTLDIIFISSVFLLFALIFSVMAYKGFNYFRRRKARCQSSGRHCQAGRPGSQSCGNVASLAPSDHQFEDAEISLVGVWMSDDINPKLIHRILLSEAGPKALERFIDSQGYLYVFSDPELGGGEVPLVSASPATILTPPAPVPVAYSPGLYTAPSSFDRDMKSR